MYVHQVEPQPIVSSPSLPPPQRCNGWPFRWVDDSRGRIRPRAGFPRRCSYYWCPAVWYVFPSLPPSLPPSLYVCRGRGSVWASLPSLLLLLLVPSNMAYPSLPPSLPSLATFPFLSFSAMPPRSSPWSPWSRCTVSDLLLSLTPSLPPSLGVKGFLAGLGAGLAGCVVLPVAGVVGGVSYIIGEGEREGGRKGPSKTEASISPLISCRNLIHFSLPPSLSPSLPPPPGGVVNTPTSVLQMSRGRVWDPLLQRWVR